MLSIVWVELGSIELGVVYNMVTHYCPAYKNNMPGEAKTSVRFLCARDLCSSTLNHLIFLEEKDALAKSQKTELGD